jgi:hypothetical protein
VYTSSYVGNACLYREREREIESARGQEREWGREKKKQTGQTYKNEVQVPIYYVSEKKVEVVPEISSGSVRGGVIM